MGILDAPGIAPVNALPGFRNGLVLVGDSFCTRNYGALGTWGAAGSTSFNDALYGIVTVANAKLGQRLKVSSVGVAGARSDEWVSANQVAAARATGAKFAFLTAPTNDRLQGRTLAQMQADVLTVIDGLRAAGIHVIVLGLLPSSSPYALNQNTADLTIQYNHWLKSLVYGGRSLLTVLDPMNVLVDTTSLGAFVANTHDWTPDGVHPENKAVWRIAKMLVDILDPLVPHIDTRPLGNMDRVGAAPASRNLLAGAGMTGTAGGNGSSKGGSGTVVSNFNVTSSDGANFAGTVVSSVVPSTGQSVTAWQQHVHTVAASRLRVQQTGIVTGFTAGTTPVRAEVEIDTDADLSAVSRLNIGIAFQVSGGSCDTIWAYQPVSPGDYPVENRLTVDARGRYPVLFTPTVIVPATCTSIGWYLDFTGLGTVRWRLPAIRSNPLF